MVSNSVLCETSKISHKNHETTNRNKSRFVTFRSDGKDKETTDTMTSLWTSTVNK